MNYINSIFTSKIFSNFIHVGMVKFANIFAKYFLVIYLVRGLQEESYGILTWVDSFIQYFLVLINFGFDIFIVKKIIENKEDKETTDKIISTVLILKFLLFLCSFFILLILIFLLNINEYSLLFLLMILMGLGEVFFPMWYFQGVQKMKYMSLTSIISKGFLVITTLFLVNHPKDLYLYVILLVISNLIYGGLGFFFLTRESKFVFIVSKYVEIKEYFKEGFLFYLGRTSTLFMNFGTIFIIGKFFSKEMVTGFDICSKVIFVFVFVFEVIQQSVFSNIVESQNKKKLAKLLTFTFLFSVIFFVFVYFFPQFFLYYLGGKEMLKHIILLKQLAILIPVIGITNILGSCGLVAFGAIQKFNFSFIFSAIVYILCIFVLYLLQKLTFNNLIFVRIFVDVIMAVIILYYSVKLKLLDFSK